MQTEIKNSNGMNTRIKQQSQIVRDIVFEWYQK